MKAVILYAQNPLGDMIPVGCDANGKIEILSSDKGWFANEAAILAAYPNGIADPTTRQGWYCRNEATNSIWMWDADTNAWVDTKNGATGDVTGPGSATDWNIAVFSGITGKIIRDSGTGMVALLAALALNTTHRTSDGKDHSDVATNNAKVGVTTQISSLLGDPSPQLAGNLDLNKKSILVNSALSSDLTVTGPIEILTAGENVVFGDFCYLKSDGKYWKIDADAEATMPIKVMATATIAADATGIFLLPSSFAYARNDAWSWSAVGKRLYGSTTAGELTETQPSGVDKVVQYAAEAKSATVIKFDASSDYIVRVA